VSIEFDIGTTAPGFQRKFSKSLFGPVEFDASHKNIVL